MVTVGNENPSNRTSGSFPSKTKLPSITFTKTSHKSLHCVRCSQKARNCPNRLRHIGIFTLQMGLIQTLGRGREYILFLLTKCPGVSL